MEQPSTLLIYNHRYQGMFLLTMSGAIARYQQFVGSDGTLVVKRLIS